MNNRFWMGVGVVLVGAFVWVILGCAGVAAPPRAAAEAPGMYNLTGWNGWVGDINGEVGHRLFVDGPRARMVPPPNDWSASYRIVSGSLPPGVHFAKTAKAIEGIPEKRGHWVVVLELYDVSSRGQSYKGLTQELRFHITGTGAVVQ